MPPVQGRHAPGTIEKINVVRFPQDGEIILHPPFRRQIAKLKNQSAKKRDYGADEIAYPPTTEGRSREIRLSRSDQVARRATRGALRSKVARGRAGAMRGADLSRKSGRHGVPPLPERRDGSAARKRRGCFGAMRSDDEKAGSDPISTRRHFAERLDGTGKM